MNYIGIDPGYSGAIAVIPDNPSQFDPFCIKNKETLTDIAHWLEERSQCQCFAIIEKVHSMPKQGVVSSFTFGRSYGNLEALLTAFNIPFDRVTPLKWQTALQCRSKGNKNITKAKAQELFPSVKCTHQISDALLLAEYARRFKEGQL